MRAGTGDERLPPCGCSRARPCRRGRRFLQSAHLGELVGHESWPMVPIGCADGGWASGDLSAAGRPCARPSGRGGAGRGTLGLGGGPVMEPGLPHRFGLHWGSTLYVGSISTAGGNEVTALGNEVNEGARIEACASGRRALASKALVDRLDATDAAPSASTRTDSPTRCWATWPRPPRRRAETLRRSPSATSGPGHPARMASV